MCKTNTEHNFVIVAMNDEWSLKRLNGSYRLNAHISVFYGRESEKAWSLVVYVINVLCDLT